MDHVLGSKASCKVVFYRRGVRPASLVLSLMDIYVGRPSEDWSLQDFLERDAVSLWTPVFEDVVVCIQEVNTTTNRGCELTVAKVVK